MIELVSNLLCSVQISVTNFTVADLELFVRNQQFRVVYRWMNNSNEESLGVGDISKLTQLGEEGEAPVSYCFANLVNLSRPLRSKLSRNGFSACA